MIQVASSKSFKVSEFKKFELSSSRSMKIIFSKTSGDELTVTLKGEASGFKNEGKYLEDWFDVVLNGDALSLLSFDKSSSKDGAEEAVTGQQKGRNLSLTIAFPESFLFEQLSFDVVSSDVSAAELNFAELRAVSVSGNLRIENSTGIEVEVESVSGDCFLEIKKTKRIKVRSNSGNTVIKSLVETPQISVQSVSGNLDLKLASDSKLSVDFQSNSGQLKNEFAGTDSNDSKVEFSSVSGNASITKI